MLHFGPKMGQKWLIFGPKIGQKWPKMGKNCPGRKFFLGWNFLNYFKEISNLIFMGYLTRFSEKGVIPPSDKFFRFSKNGRKHGKVSNEGALVCGEGIIFLRFVEIWRSRCAPSLDTLPCFRLFFENRKNFPRAEVKFGGYIANWGIFFNFWRAQFAMWRVI